MNKEKEGNTEIVYAKLCCPVKDIWSRMKQGKLLRQKAECTLRKHQVSEQVVRGTT